MIAVCAAVACLPAGVFLSAGNKKTMAQADTHHTDSFKGVLREQRFTAYPAIDSGQAPNPVEVSYPQEQLWFLSQFEPANVAYNVPLAWKLAGCLDIEVLEQCLREVVRRHEALRTSFPLVSGKPMQYANPADDFRLRIVDLRTLPQVRRQAECDRLVAEEARNPFNLSSGPVFRALVLRCADHDQILVLNVHHIVADGSSVEVLLSELETGYSAQLTGKCAGLPSLPVQYRDYSVWERRCLQPDVLERYLNNWSRHLEGAAPLELYADRPRPSVQTFQGRTEHYRLDKGLSGDLATLSRGEGCTLFMLLCAAFQTLLHRYTSQGDVVVRFHIANRNRAEIQKLIGFFINTVPLRVDFSGDPTFRGVLKRVRESMLWAYANRDLPFQKVVAKLDPERSTGRNPLFQVMIDQAQAEWMNLSLPGLTANWLAIDNGTAKFDLSLHCVLGKEELSGWLEYSTGLYDADTIGRMLAHFQLLLTGIAADPSARLSSLPILSGQERQQLVVEWNQTSAQDSSDACIPQIFEAQAERTPGLMAVESDAKSLHYRDLNCRANQLAWHLKRLGVGHETLVGVCRQHDWQTAVALLGILKAGGAYVPLDPAYPQERLAFMAKDTGIRFLLTEERWARVLPQYEGRVICLERDWVELAKESVSNPPSQATPDSLAYVLYTSGSTGRPKGVMGLHRGALNRFSWMWKEYPFAAGEVACLKTSLNFVDAVWEVFGPLLAGVTTVVIPEDAVRDPGKLIELLAKRHVTRFVCVPSMLGVLLETEPDLGRRLPHLKYWISSGEPLSQDLVRRFNKSLPAGILINLYGSSEVSADVTCFDTRNAESSGAVLIGRPIANTQIYIVDGQLRPVPIGQPGELCVGGEGLARGYWNAPEETARQFVVNPFGQGKLYRTGDRARYRPDGNIEYLGRVDYQVKIRGFRVEPGEIESLLAQHPQVKQAVVVPGESRGGKRLVAYVVPEAAPETENVSEDLQTQRIAHWREVWSETYESEGATHHAGFDISGWNSSYTGLPFSTAEMQEWVDSTVARVLALRPQRALEIGCGSGLLLSRIAPHCSAYCGTDFSPLSLRQVQKLIAEQREFHGVTLLQRSADDFSGLAPASFDTVILNSVVQYFPSVHYLMRVLEGAVKVTRPGGTIFVGDVRDFRLLEAFHLSVELGRAPASMGVSKLRQQVDKRLAEDPELAVDPALFPTLGELFPSNSAVKLLPKRGVYSTEMNRFRYDVVLRGGSGSAVPGYRCTSDTDDQKIDWKENRLSLAKLQAVLRERPERLRITSVPNRRVTMDTAAFSLLRESENLETVSDLRNALQQVAETGVDPEEISCVDPSYAVQVELSATRSDCCEVSFNRTSGIAQEDFHPISFPASAGPLTSYANNPLRGAHRLKLASELRQYLRERVPDYMVPAVFVTLESLPLTPNGKIDRRALPVPDDARPELRQAYVEPASSLERTIQSIWREVLQMDRVGTHDNFFDLGGHSLRLVVVHSKLAQALTRELSIIDLFQYPSIHSLARHLANEDPGQQPLNEVRERAQKQKETVRRRAILASRLK